MTKKTMTIQDLRNMVDGHDGEDRISTLPDELIEHIFSFVNIKLVVQVCLLSKRWRNLWTSLGFLNFRSQYYDSDGYDYDNKKDESHKFVSSFLAKRDPHSHTSTVLIHSLQKSTGNLIIDYAISHNVKHLHLFHHCGYEDDNYNYNLSFPVLETLHITSSRQPLEYWSMPSLTILYLEGALSDYSKALMSIEGFYNLKELTLKGWDGWCDFGGDTDSLMIKCPNLVCLTISISWSRYRRMYKFVISAPKLSSFKFSGMHVPVLSAEGGFPILKEVDFDLYDCQENIDKELYSFFSEFQATKFLTLSRGVIQVLSKLLNYSECWRPSPPFGNLKTLHILWPNFCNMYLFDGCPGLNNVIEYLLNGSSGVKIFIEDCNSEEDILLNESFSCRVVKISRSPIQVDAAVLHRVIGVRPPSTLDEKFFNQGYSYDNCVSFSLWEGHHVYKEHLMLLSYIKKKQPQTFEHFAPKTGTAFTLGLNALCSSIKAFSDVSSLSASTITHFRDLFTDLEKWGFNTTWLVNILSNVTEISPTDLIHEK